MNSFDSARLADLTTITLFLLFLFAVFVVWVAACIGVIELAKEKGRNQWFWALSAFFVASPFLVLIALYCMPPNQEKLIDVGMKKICPFCISLIDPRARRCPECSADLER